jgi:RpiB/LacA/LacB family sugar-phosphate isomerase
MTTPKKTIFLATDPFGTPLHQALLPFLREQGLDVQDLGTGDYYTKAADVGRAVAAAAAAPRLLCSSSSSSPSTTTTNEAQGIVICGTGMGVCIAANKVPGIRAAVAENIAAAVNSKSVNNSNVLALGAMVTDVENAKEIVSAWLNAEFKGLAPANEGEGWTEDIKIFLEKSMPALAQLDGSRAKEEEEQEQQQQEGASSAADANCCPVGALQAGCSSHPFVIVSGIEGAEWVVLRENPTRALVRFQKGSVEPSHYHTFGHDVFVTKGRKRVENLTRGETFEMNEGSYLYTKAGERHRVTYFEDTEFVLSCDGGFDVFWEEGGNEGWKEDGKKKNAV